MVDHSLFTIHYLPFLMDHEPRLRIILEKPPAGVDFGLQSGRGNDYQTLQTQRSKGKDLSFEFTVRAKPGKDSAPNFLGPLVQGPTGERFVYIDIGTYAGQKETCWSRRLKIPLRGITWDMIDRVSANAGLLLETRIPGTGQDGSPACAMVKPFPGWKLAS
jgi:uncharacterized protein DUF5990